MNNISVKEKIDVELKTLCFSEDMKQNVKNSKKRGIGIPHKITRYAAAIAAIVMLGGTTVFAGYMLLNRVNVNDTTLPELDNMTVINYTPLNTEADETGIIDQPFTDYDEIADTMGFHLLDTELADDSSYAQGNVMTDNKDFAILSVENYILGDTHDYTYLPEEQRYQYESGSAYFSPISLTVDIILSDNQFNNGWETDYLGMYEYVESYTSSQGYKVNLIQDTTDAENDQYYVSEKCAVFVADGIRYTLKGRTSLETMKEIVDSMDY